MRHHATRLREEEAPRWEDEEEEGGDRPPRHVSSSRCVCEMRGAQPPAARGLNDGSAGVSVATCRDMEVTATKFVCGYPQISSPFLFKSFKNSKAYFFEPSICFMIHLNHHVPFDEFYQVRPILHIFWLSDVDICHETNNKKISGRKQK